MTYAISDIHGDWDAFSRMFGLGTAENIAGFGPDDRCVVIGDAVDRGLDGVRILQHVRSDGRFQMILGNHEYMCLQAMMGGKRKSFRDIWGANAGQPTYEGLMRLGRLDRRDLLRWLSRCPDHLDIDAGGQPYRLVHAGWYGDDKDARLWRQPCPYKPMPADGRHVILGHTPVCRLHPGGPSGYLSRCGDHMRIFRCDAFTAIDCGCGMPKTMRKRALGCLRLDDCAEFYIHI